MLGCLPSANWIACPASKDRKCLSPENVERSQRTLDDVDVLSWQPERIMTVASRFLG